MAALLCLVVQHAQPHLCSAAACHSCKPGVQAAYLLAVLAENHCTHERIKQAGCQQVLIRLMEGGSARAARAANAGVVSLASNADNHFGLVSHGLVPALVATLQSGDSAEHH